MDEQKQEHELHTGIHLMMLITIFILSAAEIILNVMMDWEKWMIPIVIAGTVLCWAMRFAGKPDLRMQRFLCAFFLMFEAFYYAVNVQTVHDSGALLVILVVLLAFTGERILLFLGLLTGCAGLIFHLISSGSGGGLYYSMSYIVRTVGEFCFLILAAILVDRISRAWKSTEQGLVDEIQQVREENTRVNNFLANVSHEIRTPINAVMGLSAVIENEELPPEVTEKVDAISRAGHRVADQIGDILDFTEIDMNELSVNREDYMIGSLVNDLLTQLQYTESYGLDLVVDMEPDIPCELIGDATKIKKILLHLISNGYKFTKEGGVGVHIYAIKRDYGINLVLEVKDTGIGMDEDELEHVYDKFYQSDSGRSRVAGGLGLGIPIVNGFTLAMGGVMALDSRVGTGTAFRVSIPQEVVDDSPCLSVANRENTMAAGYLGFMTTGHPSIREYYMEMIGHLSAQLGVSFHRAQSLEELEDIINDQPVTHLFVGTGEYLENKEFIDELSLKMNVALVADIGYEGGAGGAVSILPKPFYGAQVANFLNHSFDEKGVYDERMTCPGVKALVVDDEPMNLLVAKGIFESYGMEVTTADSGQESIDLCLVNDYDIIFMDHMMPEMDGLEAMKRLRINASKARKELCIVALTANAISSAKEMFLSEGFDGFVPKPIEIADLERVLKHVLPKSAVVYEKTDLKKNKRWGLKEAEPKSDRDKKSGGFVNKKDPRQGSIDMSRILPDKEKAADPYEPLRNVGVNIEEGLRYCQKDKDLYRELLLEYSKDRDKKCADITAFYENSNWKDYAIKVHAIKSTSKMMGAAEVSGLAKDLEFAAKDEDADFVIEKHDAFMKRYNELLDAIEESTGVKQSGSKESESAHEVLEFAAGGGDEEVLEFSAAAKENAAAFDEKDDGVLEFAPKASGAPANDNGRGGETL